MSIPFSSPLPLSLALLRATFHTRVTSSSSQPLLLIRKQSYIHLSITTKPGSGMSLIPGSCSSIPSIHVFPWFCPTVPFSAWQISGSRQGRDSFQEADKNTDTFFGDITHTPGKRITPGLFSLETRTRPSAAKPRPPLTPVGAQASFIVNVFTGHHLKDREFEEDKLKHLLFHFELLERM